jgi:hypothetical protein
MERATAKRIGTGTGGFAWTARRLAPVANGRLGRPDGALGERCAR